MRFRNVPSDLHPGSWRNLTPANDAARFWPACYSCGYVSPCLFMTDCSHILCQDCVTVASRKRSSSVESDLPSERSLSGRAGRCGACFQDTTVVEAPQYEWFLHHAQFRCACGFEGTLKLLHGHYSGAEGGCVAEQTSNLALRTPSAANATAKRTRAIQIAQAPVQSLVRGTQTTGSRCSAMQDVVGETENDAEENNTDEVRGREGHGDCFDGYKERTPLAHYLEPRLSSRRSKLDCIEELHTFAPRGSLLCENNTGDAAPKDKQGQEDGQHGPRTVSQDPIASESPATALPLESASDPTSQQGVRHSATMKMAASVDEGQCSDHIHKNMCSAKITPRLQCRRSSEPVITFPPLFRAKILSSTQSDAKSYLPSGTSAGRRMADPMPWAGSNGADGVHAGYGNSWSQLNIRRGSLFSTNRPLAQDQPRSPIRPDDGLSATIDRVTWFKFGIKAILMKLQNGSHHKIVLPTVYREIGGHKFSMACRVEDNESLHVFLGASASSPDVQWPLEKRITVGLLNGRGEVFSEFSFNASNLFFQPTAEAQRMICRMCPIHELPNIAFSDESGPYITVRLTMAALT
ncbi:hypothetical protein BIW11_05221 [Tropilaelaps mercedesae]|uniref:RING-type domain-containing protein n=1 Tax=Tropilaelaps mercedesae TaxID=418985 RepID=A0A1V9Y3B8_9ACAR|nr:hypothetical protein BIW11_05221 [Tropilaelaps mercedesae]